MAPRPIKWVGRCSKGVIDAGLSIQGETRRLKITELVFEGDDLLLTDEEGKVTRCCGVSILDVSPGVEIEAEGLEREPINFELVPTLSEDEET